MAAKNRPMEKLGLLRGRFGGYEYDIRTWNEDKPSLGLGGAVGGSC